MSTIISVLVTLCGMNMSVSSDFGARSGVKPCYWPQVGAGSGVSWSCIWFKVYWAWKHKIVCRRLNSRSGWRKFSSSFYTASYWVSAPFDVEIWARIVCSFSTTHLFYDIISLSRLHCEVSLFFTKVMTCYSRFVLKKRKRKYSNNGIWWMWFFSWISVPSVFGICEKFILYVNEFLFSLPSFKKNMNANTLQKHTAKIKQ